MRYRYWISFAASILLATIFITAGVGKLMGESAFLLTISTFIVDQQVAETLTSWLPWIELGLGFWLLVGIAPQIAAGLSALLIAAFMLHNGWMIANGFSHEPCSCLGIFDRIFGGTMSTIGSLWADIVLMALALTIYFGYPGKLLNRRPWIYKWRETAGIARKEEPEPSGYGS